MLRRSPKIQKHIYFLIQKLRKEPVKQAWEEIKTQDHTDKKALKERVLHRGRSHLEYILNNVPKYMELKNRGHILTLLKKVKDIREFDDLLKQLPITYKQEIIETPHKLRSKEEKSIPTFETVSSGTTGQSIKFPKDMRDWARSHANMFYILSLYHINPFSPYVFYWASDWYFKTKIEYFEKDLLLNRLRLNSYNTSASYLYKQYKKMIKFRPHYLYGMPSAIFAFSNYILGNKLPSPKTIQSIFTTGEMLYPAQRNTIKKAFNVPVVNIYGSSEVGIISFDCPFGHHHVLMDTNYMEVMEDGTILITNLFQKAFAMVRYKIGDIASSGLKWEHTCKLAYPIIDGFSGRETEKIVMPNGKKIPTMGPTFIFERVANTRSIIKYRYELDEKTLILKLIVNNRFNKRIEDIIIKESEKLFGIRPKIEIVDNIPPLRGGKESYFIYKDARKKT